MCGDAAQDERRQEGQRDDEGVEEAVVALSHAVPHPGTVVVEALWRRSRSELTICVCVWGGGGSPTHAVVTQAAVGGPRRPEHPAGEAVLELHRLLVDDHLQGSRRRAEASVSRTVCGGEEHQPSDSFCKTREASGESPPPAPERRKAGTSRRSPPSPPLTDLLLQLRRLVRRGPGQDARVAEAGAQQGEQHEQEEDAPDGRYAAGQVLDQEGTAGTFSRVHPHKRLESDGNNSWELKELTRR